jgi:hypothetical protein
MKKLLPLVALLSGCASITDGTEQTIVFNVQPRETTCAASRNGVELSQFTARDSTLTVSKGAKDIVITCKAPGYQTKVARLVSSTQGAGMVSFFLLDFGITDMVTGAMWKYPSNSSIVLEREDGEAVAAPAPASTPETTVAKAPPKQETGQDLFTVNKLAVAQGCAADPKATMTGKGPGYEAYAVPCANGDMLMIRCDMGNCRALR